MKKKGSGYYDSHCHFLATGQMQKGLKLFDLKSPEEVSALSIAPHHFQGGWLIGFGWDQHRWEGKWKDTFPTKEILDKIFPDFPVVFSRADGHACWVNSVALGQIGKISSTGIFIDKDHIEVLMRIPPLSTAQKYHYLKAANDYFVKAGFTHIRDMSCNEEQWNILREMDGRGELGLFVEENFTCENLRDFMRALGEALRAKKNPSPHLRVSGIKFYFDGALGSEGACLSHPYGGNRKHGTLLWNKDDVETVMTNTWREKLSVCVHAIGDEAAHQIALIATKLKKQGIRGELNLEHAQVLRPETIKLLQELDVICHLQPCHWLTDHRWLKEKLGDLFQYAFPWAALEKAGVRFQFGSDSPIEEASVQNNLLALEKSAHEGIPALKGDPLAHHHHPDWH